MPDKMIDTTNSREMPPIDRYPAAVQPGAETAAERRPGPGMIDELLVGQVFLVQATIESASALGEGLQAARKALHGDGEVGEVLRRTGQGVFRPYRDRLQWFRQLPRQRRD